MAVIFDSCCNQAWVLKNSFQGISTTKFVCKLLSVRSPKSRKFREITALVPFSTPTGDYTQNPVGWFQSVRAVLPSQTDPLFTLSDPTWTIALRLIA